MEDSVEFQKLSRFAIHSWFEKHTTNSSRVNDLVISQSDWYYMWLVGVKPMSVRSHMASGTCISIPVNSCIRNEG